MSGNEAGTEERERRREERFRIFVGHLGSGEAPYRWGAAEALGRMGDPRAVDHLIPLLEDPDWRVRLKAAWSLGEIGDPRALPYLMRLHRDESEAVRDIAKESGQKIRMERLRAPQDGS
jgi:HEAT repeat protein